MPAIYKNGLLYAGTSGGSGANTDIIADEYTEKAYAVGDYCIHEDALYKCNTAITVAESWTAAHWTEKDIATELKAINNTISILGTASTKNVAVSGDASLTEVVMGNDSRLTNSRTPVSHTHTKSEITDFPTLGTAAGKDVPSSGNASTSQVVMGDDTRLTDSRSASDVYSWAKASSKPSYTANEVGAIASTLKGAANGVAELDANGLVPSSQLPSYVDDVLEYVNKASFPATGETGKIYVDTTTNLTYRWSGSAYTEISPSLAIGTTSSTAFRGDYGQTAYSHATDVNRLTTAQSEGLYKIATSAEGHVKSVSAVQKSDITGLGIPGSDTDRYVNSASFADDSTDTAASPIKMTLTRAGSDSATVTANIPKVSSSSAGVVPKGAAVESQSQSTKFLREDGSWAAPSYTDASGFMNTSNPSGTGSFSMNRKTNTTVGNYSTAEGYNCTASGSYSHAEGESTTASGRYGSHAEGLGAEASGDSSHAEGSSTTASGECSHAEGGATTAGARYSHAEGNSTTANAEDAHAEGLGCTASGLVSHAEGGYTTSSGSYSHAEGRYTTAQRKSQHVFGEYNVLDTTGDTTTKGDYVEIVGNGTSSARSNARTLDWNGNEWIAGNYKSDALTASKLLVSDANKNITSSSLAESDLITTSNIGSQSVLSATQASQSSYSNFLHSYNQNGVIYSDNEYLFRPRYNVKSDSRFYLEIYNNNNDTTTYEVRVDYATSAANAIKWNNITYDMSTLNTTDTWIPVLSSGKFQHCMRELWSSVQHCDWNNTNKRSYLPTLSCLALWNGAYNANGNSNLAYCNRGAFGTVVTKSSDDVVGTYTDGTFYKAAHLITFKGSDNALVGGGKGNYVWGISSWSDSRLKDNIKDSQVNALDIINNIKMREFDFKDKKYGEHKDIGYVAQELKEVIPECVVNVPISEEEQEEYQTDTLMQVEDKHLVKYLVKAIQELSQKINEQQQEINELKRSNLI